MKMRRRNTDSGGITGLWRCSLIGNADTSRVSEVVGSIPLTGTIHYFIAGKSTGEDDSLISCFSKVQFLVPQPIPQLARGGL